jgi:hypothetical protein
MPNFRGGFKSFSGPLYIDNMISPSFFYNEFTSHFGRISYYMTLAGTYFATLLLIKFILESLGKIYQGFEIRKLTSNTMGAGKLIASTLFNVFYITAMNEKFTADIVESKSDNDNKNDNNPNNNNNNDGSIYPKADIGQLAIQYQGNAPLMNYHPFYNSSQQGFGIPPPQTLSLPPPHYRDKFHDHQAALRNHPPPLPKRPPTPTSTLTITEIRQRDQPEVPVLKGKNPAACEFIPAGDDSIHNKTLTEIDEENDLEVAECSFSPEIDRNVTGSDLTIRTITSTTL